MEKRVWKSPGAGKRQRLLMACGQWTEGIKGKCRLESSEIIINSFIECLRGYNNSSIIRLFREEENFSVTGLLPLLSTL